MIINNNIAALNASRYLNLNNRDSIKTIEKLASGMRINTAGDDASGLAVSEKMRAQFRGLKQANRNAQNGISFIQTTEGYLNEASSILQRMRELAIQSANGIYSDSDRALIQLEVNQLIEEVDRISSHAEFNKMNMLTGRFAPGGVTMAFHIGPNMDQRFAVTIATMTAVALGIATDTGDDNVSISTVDAANASLGRIDNALETVVAQRATLGAYQNRLEHVVRGLSIATENTIASESLIRDADMASAMVDYAKEQILRQTSAAMLANANMNTQVILRLLN